MPSPPPRLSATLLHGDHCVCRLPPHAAVPGWAWAGEAACVVRTPGALVVVCSTAGVPTAVNREGGWRGLRVAAPPGEPDARVFPAIADALVAAGVPFWFTPAFGAAYVMVEDARLATALAALRQAGHGVSGPEPADGDSEWTPS